MKQISAILLSLFFVLTFSTAVHSQWVQTKGPYGGIVRCLASNSKYIFIGTYYGVFRSSNNGKNWFRASLGITDNYINSLATIDTFLFASTAFETFRSTNNGASWFKLNNGVLFGTGGMLVSDTVLYSKISGSYGMSYSTDYGLSWKSITPFPYNFSPISIIRKDSNLYAGCYNDGVYQLFKSGNDWITTHIGLENHRVVALAIDGTFLYAATDTNGVFRTSDNGKNWNQVNSGLQSLSISTLLCYNGFIFVVTSDGLYRSRTQGNSWEKVNAQLSGLDIKTIQTFNNVLYVGTYNGIYTSTDNGNNWQQINGDFISTGITSILNINERLFVITNNTGVFVSPDFGESWESLNTGLNTKFYSMIRNGDTLLSATNNGVYISTDLGVTWRQSGLDKKYTTTVVTKDAHLFAGTNCCGIYHSSDNGNTWVEVNNGLPTLGIYKMASNNSYLYVIDWDLVLYRSGNLGTSWEKIEFPKGDGKIFDIVVNDTNVYVADHGVMYSSDNGTNWVDRVNGITNTIYEISQTNSNLFAGSYAGNIFHSIDNGLSWKEIGFGLPDSYTGPFVVTSQYLFAGIHNAGLWRRPLSEIVSDVEATPTQNSGQLLLSQNKPNPAQHSTTIEFSIPTTAYTTVVVFNSLGQQVATLISEELEAGTYSRQWNTTTIESGIYFYQLRSGSLQTTKQLHVVR